jgi:glycosyltransferase involved in cell wall biosynthesis
LAAGTLVILSPGFPAGEGDLVSMPYLQMFIKALRSSFPQVKIHIISFQFPFERGEYNWQGCTVHALAGRNKKWNRFFIWRKADRLLKKIHSEEQVIGLLSLWLTECTYVAQRFAKKHKVKLLAWSMGQDVKRTNRYMKHLDFSAFTSACMSPFSEAQLYINHQVRVQHIIGNSIDPKTIPLPEPKEQRYDILSVGAFSNFKRFDWVVDVVKELRNEFPGIKACMVGTGPEWEAVRKKIKMQDLEKHIELKGTLPHADCLGLMMHSRLLLHPSSFEGASTVILEALYYQCYVISVTVPAEKMPPTFYRVETKEEMIAKTREVLSMRRNETSYCVSTSEESAKKVLELLGYVAPAELV